MIKVIIEDTHHNIEINESLFQNWPHSNIKSIEHIIPSSPNYKKELLEKINKDYGFVLFIKNHFSPTEITTIDFSVIKNAFFKEEDVFCFSYSLYEANVFSEKYKSPNKLVPIKKENGLIFWDWTKHYFDYGNPFSIFDGHIFRTKEIYKLISKVSFSSSEELEDALQIFQGYPKNIMFSPIDKCLLFGNDKIDLLNNEIINKVPDQSSS